jgi:sodium/pantothenate symporter
VIPKLLVTADIITLPVYLDPIVIGAASSLVVVLFVSRKTVVSDAEREYRLSLLKTPKEELIPKEAETTLRYAYAIGIFGIVMTILLLILYVAPYQSALATDRENFSFNWLTGEAFLSYATGSSFVFMGWLIRRSVISDYR